MSDYADCLRAAEYCGAQFTVQKLRLFYDAHYLLDEAPFVAEWAEAALRLCDRDDARRWLTTGHLAAVCEPEETFLKYLIFRERHQRDPLAAVGRTLDALESLTWTTPSAHSLYPHQKAAHFGVVM